MFRSTCAAALLTCLMATVCLAAPPPAHNVFVAAELMARVVDVESRLAAMKTKYRERHPTLARQRARLIALKSALTALPTPCPSCRSASYPRVRELLAGARNHLMSLETRYGPKHPEIIGAQARKLVLAAYLPANYGTPPRGHEHLLLERAELTAQRILQRAYGPRHPSVIATTARLRAVNKALRALGEPNAATRQAAVKLLWETVQRIRSGCNIPDAGPGEVDIRVDALLVEAALLL